MAGARKRRVIVAFSGASGPEYPLRILDLLAGMGVESHFVMSRSAKVSLAHESDLKVRDFEDRATRVYDNADIAAPIASGSFLTDGMIIAPCSAKSLGEIAAGIGGTLIARAADVVLKERRRLVLMLRETPLHLGHLRLMTQVTEAGAVLVPPLPAFYHKPKTLEDVIMQSVNKALDQFDLELDLFQRWTGNEEREALKKR